MLGALAPDVDVPVALAGWDRYLRVHEVGTHSIAGAAIVACAAAAVVHLVDRPVTDATDRGQRRLPLAAAPAAP